MLAAQRSIPVGRLRIAVPNTFGRMHVMPLLNQFCQQNPEMQINLAFSDRFVDLFEEGVDIAIRIGGPAEYPPSLGFRFLGNEKLIFCASPGYLARQGMPGLAVEGLPLYIVWPRKKQLTPKVAALLSALERLKID